jgi:hypothetical protein
MASHNRSVPYVTGKVKSGIIASRSEEGDVTVSGTYVKEKATWGYDRDLPLPACGERAG